MGFVLCTQCLAMQTAEAYLAFPHLPNCGAEQVNRLTGEHYPWHELTLVLNRLKESRPRFH